MPEDEILLLPEDKHYAKERVAELDRQIQDLGPEFYDALNQSSETWHDNAPFDALRDRQSALDAERQSLKDILRRSAITLPQRNDSIVDTGCTVSLNDKSGRSSRYFIAGDWTPSAGEKKDNAIIISRVSPLAQVLIGHTIDELVNFRKKYYTIVNINY